MRDVRVDLERIVMCAERVIESTDGSSFDEFVANDLRYDATLRNLEIMGEAAKRAPESIRARFSAYPGATARSSGIGWRMPMMRSATGLCGTRCAAACRRRWWRFVRRSTSLGDNTARARADDVDVARADHGWSHSTLPSFKDFASMFDSMIGARAT